MEQNQEPLLTRRLSSDQNDRDLAEEDTLLKERKNSHNAKAKQWRETGLTLWALLATIAVVVLAILFHQSLQRDSRPRADRPQGKRNLIFMISDGMGVPSLTLTRSYLQLVNGATSGKSQLTLDDYEIGKSRTRSTSSLITDSAAGATAFSCGKKSYNGAISALPDLSPCGTVMEAAKRAGYTAGLVVTTRITDATPAAFAAHVYLRAEEDLIAGQLLGEYPLGKTVDLMLGAGRCHFMPNSSETSCRKDKEDMIARARSKGFTYIGNREEFDHLQLGTTVQLPLLGLFAPEDIPYEIDRRFQKDIYPSLAEMTRTALNALKEATKDKEHGFFLMVEGSRIDHAGHANDASAQIHEVLAYDEAFREVLNFLDEDDTEGLLIATSDHETGGLATAKQLDPYSYPEYRWFPGVLANVTHSVSWMGHEYARYVQESHTEPSLFPIAGNDHGKNPSDDLTARDTITFLRKLIEDNLGVSDASDAEISVLIEEPLQFAPWIFADMVSRRSQTGWTTHGHSGADVNIYASDRTAAQRLQGNHENTEVGDFLMYYLDVHVDDITLELKEKGISWAEQNTPGRDWMGRKPENGENIEGGSHLDRYQGQFRKAKERDISIDT